VSEANDVTGGGCLPKRDFTRTVLANENARALRKRLTPQEVKLWVKLRELKLLGFHFRRQAPIGRYIVDFASFRSRLVIEADGGQHGVPADARSDQVRDAFLQSQGFRVLRFWNSDIDANLAGVIDSILSALRDPPPDRPSAGHPPHEGEG
jgi:very-short-patch-repair endonuclease